MKRSAIRLFLPVLALCMLWAGMVPANAAAKRKAAVSWSLTPTVNEGAPIPFSWSAARLGRNYRLVIQRPFGTVHVWKSIMRLQTTSGSATLPGSGLGTRRFRIAAFRGSKLLAKQVSSVSIFGTVQFTTLLQIDSPAVHTMTGNSFSYVREWSVGGDYSENLFGVSNNNCSSVHVAFAVGSWASESRVIGTVTVVQESRDPVSSSVPFEGTGSVDAELTPGQTWGVNASTQGGVGEFFINGYATCYSTEPFHQ